MRIYEFSKKYDTSNKEVIEFLTSHGFEAASHMSVIPTEALSQLEQFFAPKSKETPASVVQEKTISPVAEKKPTPIAVKETVVPTPKAVEKAAQPAVSMPKKTIEPQRSEEKTKEVTPRGIIAQPMPVGELAVVLDKPVSEVILFLLRQGIVATKNQIVSEKVVSQLAQHFGVPLLQPAPVEKKEVVQKPTTLAPQEGNVVERLPIVVVIGHVDHGKTTLLDFIRKTRVASREKGGITQHLGAYLAKTEHGSLVFLDTPGHEAFTIMRGRGLKVADLAILVVAADDGIMPQTIEAIRQAKAVGLPIVVAINKIDKASPAQIEAVKRGLAQYEVLPEEWGGETVCVPISAKLGQGVNELLEVVVLQSKLMELTANVSVPARGFVLESRLEKGRGPVGTVICQHGILHVGDYFVAGSQQGRINSLVDSFGTRVQSVEPSIPVQVAGFSELPQAGDFFEVVTAQQIKKGKPEIKQTSLTSHQVRPENAINLIIKTDVVSSQEAVLNAVGKMSGKAFKEFYIISSGVGSITERDIMLAADTSAIVYGLHAKIESNAAALAQKLGVIVKLFDIIYRMLEDLTEIAEKGKPVKKVLRKVGEATIIKVFDIKNVGIIAGAMLKSGRFVREGGKVVVWRGKHKVGEGVIASLQRDKKAVKEVHAGYEFAFTVTGFTDWQIDDRVECMMEVAE